MSEITRLAEAIEALAKSQIEIADSIEKTGERLASSLDGIGSELRGLGQEIGTAGTIERGAEGNTLYAVLSEIAEAVRQRKGTAS